MEHPMNKRSFTIMDNENLLNSIYQNIAMVLETIPEIRKITTDCDFKALIISQEEEYQNLSDSVKDTITSNGDSTEELRLCLIKMSVIFLKCVFRDIRWE